MRVRNYGISGRQQIFRICVVVVWVLLFLITVLIQGTRGYSNKTRKIIAIAFVAANIVWIIGLEIGVQSERSGKSLFKTYV